MIVSHRHRFIFIRTMKTAGTSIETFLSRFCGPEDIVTPIDRPAIVTGGFYDHMSALEILQRVGSKVWDSYYRWCVERNPWDKMLSYYWMQVAWGNKQTFDRFVTMKNFCHGYQLYTDASRERIIVNKVFLYEQLADSLKGLFSRLGIPFDGDLRCRARSEYRKDRRPYREVYTESQRKIVEDAYAWEIKTFGYEF